MEVPLLKTPLGLLLFYGTQKYANIHHMDFHVGHMAGLLGKDIGCSYIGSGVMEVIWRIRISSV